MAQTNVQVFSGNVGIGTATSDTKFTLYGDDTQDEGGLLMKVVDRLALDNGFTGIGLGGYATTSAPIIQVAKSAIIHERTGYNGTGNLMFCNDDTTDNNDVSNTHARMTITGAGNVGIGTTSPSDALHVYGAPMVQHDTYYDTASAAGWYKIGEWSAGTGARLKISFLGGNGYSSAERERGGEAILYASCNNNFNSSSIANIDGSIHAHGKPVVTQVKFEHINSSRYEFAIYAYVQSYSRMSMTVECNITTSFTKFFTTSSDPGAESATVSHAIFTHVVDNDGNVGIGRTDPKAPLHVNYDKAIINGQMSLQTFNVYKTAGGNTGSQTRRYYRVYVPNAYANFQIIFQGFARNYLGNGDIQDWRRQYTVQRNFGAGVNIGHDSGEDINASGFTFATSQTGGVTGVIEVHFDVTFPFKPENATYITFTAQVIGDTGYFAENTSV